jgi:hypothetical protein
MNHRLFAIDIASAIHSSISSMMRTREYKECLMRARGVSQEMLSLTWFVADATLRSMEIAPELLRQIRFELNENWKTDLSVKHRGVFERLVRDGIAEYEDISGETPERYAAVATAVCVCCDVEDERLHLYIRDWCGSVTEAIHRSLQRIGFGDRSTSTGIMRESAHRKRNSDIVDLRDVAEHITEIGDN